MRIIARRNCDTKIVHILAGIFLVCSGTFSAADVVSRCSTSCNKYARLRRNPVNTSDYKFAPSDICPFVADVLDDTAALMKNVVFSRETYQIVTAVFPAYVVARMIDGRIQDNFFCHTHRCNINQMPKWTHTFGKVALGIPISIFGLLALFSTNPELQTTSYMSLLGMPFVIWGKDSIKHVRCEESLRPWHETYAPYWRKTGGFPSGHLAELSFLAGLFWLRYGPRAGVPLTISAAVVAGIFLNGNRHYLSQMVAGVGLGVIFAYAANKVVDCKLAKRFGDQWRCCFDTNDHGKPAVAVSYRF